MTATANTTVRRIDAAMRWFLRHWLATFNVVNAATLAGAVLTPLLRVVGWDMPATLLYWAYRPLCPQRPDHSFFIGGYKMAFEQRETAIFLGLLIGGLLFAPVRGRLRPLDWRLLILFNLPMLIDVLTQTVGLRDSAWTWRMATGLLGSLAGVWWLYPYLEREFGAGATPRVAAPRAPTPREQAREIVLREALKEQA